MYFDSHNSIFRMLGAGLAVKLLHISKSSGQTVHSRQKGMAIDTEKKK